MNIVTLVGSIIDMPVLREFESGAKGTMITLRVARPFKSLDGLKESDFIKCYLWEGIAQSVCEYCTKGDVIGVRGRLSTYTEEVVVNCETANHVKRIAVLQFIVERVSFISTSKKYKEQYDESHPFQDLVEETQ